MDTGTHVVMGIALGGLATLDPVVYHDPLMTKAVIAATIIGSQAPDFDTVLKLKNNAVYLRNHRGITHSLPAIFVWPFMIAGGISMIVPDVNYLHLWLWTFLAVFLHVFVDIFNAYGTQALRPISHKWIALGVINIFDQFIFILHLIAIIFWRYGFDPGVVFLSLYLILITYYLWRFKARNQVIADARKLVPDASHVFISPTYHWRKWHLVIRNKNQLQVAQWKKGKIECLESYPFEPIPKHPLIDAAREDENLAAFLSFSPTYRWEIEELGDISEVRFIDLRYRSKGHYPFVAIVQLDEQKNIISSFTGWVYSEETLKRKLELAMQ